MKVAIIDYQLCNLFSVIKACAKVEIEGFLSSNKQDIKNADAIILPGVGAFGKAMHNLEELDLIETIKEAVKNGKHLFGICLGLQLLFSKSEEMGSYKGLDIIKGEVLKFPQSSGENKLKIPQIGWNKIIFNKFKENTPLSSISDNEFMYFVHSYYVKPDNPELTLTTTSYMNFNYCSCIHKENIFATQFHPEKSGINGLEIYQSWKNIIMS